MAQGTQRNVRKINKEIIRKQKAAKKFSNQWKEKSGKEINKMQKGEGN